MNDQRNRVGIRIAGFTLIEVVIVVAIIGVLAAIGVPMYQSNVEIARTEKARQELKIIALSIDIYRADNDGGLPRYLAEIGHGGRRDPWGREYLYLNFTTGTGDGYQWAVDIGLADPGIFIGEDGEGLPPEGAAATMPIVGLNGAMIDPASAEAADMFALADGSATPAEITIEVEKVRRRDQYLFPLNSDYDLFSLGPNGMTAASLSAARSMDDVIRANDGGYFGVASEY